MSSNPRAIATAHTLDFIAFYLASTTARILEVGCGEGDLAVELKKLGHEVVAIDANAEVVAAARAKGVAARHCAFGDFSDATGFDTILFTSSLHHISPLDQTLTRARRLLRPHGTLLIEEFDWQAPDAAALTWMHGWRALLETPSTDDFPDATALRAAWDHRHTHHPRLHTGAEIDSALRAAFGKVEAGTAPYLYRYASRYTQSEAIVRHLLQWENRLIESGALPAIGRRWLATNPRA